MRQPTRFVNKRVRTHTITEIDVPQHDQTYDRYQQLHRSAQACKTRTKIKSLENDIETSRGQSQLPSAESDALSCVVDAVASARVVATVVVCVGLRVSPPVIGNDVALGVCFVGAVDVESDNGDRAQR